MSFQLNRTLFILEAEIQHELPRAIFGCVRRPIGIMDLKPLIEAGGDAYVALIWNCKALDEIDVLSEAVPLHTRATRCFGGQPS